MHREGGGAFARLRTYVRLRVRATHARTRDTTRLRVGITFGLSRVQDGCEEFTAILGELSPGAASDYNGPC